MERPNRPSIIIRYRPLEFIYHPEILRGKGEATECQADFFVVRYKWSRKVGNGG